MNRTRLNRLVSRIPLVGTAVRTAYHRWIRPPKRFTSSAQYWDERYAVGGDSGAGSRGKKARFKAEIINDFVRRNEVATVIEFGCGDGGQLELAEYPTYIGFDVSAVAVARCRQRFADDATKSFALMADYAGERAELVLSLDVIYHLVEDEVYEAYMRRLFDAAKKYVIVYSSNGEALRYGPVTHVRHRKFTDWVEAAVPQWRLLAHLPNRYPTARQGRAGSVAEFFIYHMP